MSGCVDLGPDDLLFPQIERKKTWLMVKKDLERVGIPYETPEGIADFHAAGRHSLRHRAAPEWCNASPRQGTRPACATSG